MGNLNSKVSLTILVKSSIPKDKEKYIIAVMQPWIYRNYKIVRVSEDKYFDDFIHLSEYDDYAIVDTWSVLSEARLARFRGVFKCLVIFESIDQYKKAMQHVKPRRPYTWKRFAEYVEPHVELNSAGDARFSPLFMKIGQTSIEEYYQLYCKGWKYAGIDNWKDVKHREPLKFIGIAKPWSREEVEKDKDFLYIFTDNLLRTSGHNIIGNSWYRKEFLSTQNEIYYPNYTQAVIRGLENAYPITTMKDCYKHQLDNINVCNKVWESEIGLIQRALQSGKYKGIKFSAQHPFGQGQYSRLTEELQNLLNSRLKQIGIDNENCRPIIRNFEFMVKAGYKNYFFKNSSMFYELAVLGKDRVFTERYATTDNTQVRYYCELLNEYYNL